MKQPALLFPFALCAVLLLSACQQEATSVSSNSAGTAAPGNAVGTADPWSGKTVDGITQLKWADLIPPGNRETLYDKVSKRSLMTEENDDPFSKTILAVTRVISDHAPVVESLNGRRVRLAGLVVPLEWQGEKMSEFLLVPYFGACVHVPPPPANQIVYVKTTTEPVDMLPLFGSVSVTGKLITDYSHREEGDAGYTIESEKVELYE